MALNRPGRRPASGTEAGSKVSAMRAILGSRMLTAGLAAFLMAMLMGFHVVAQTDSPVKGAVATAASAPKSQFECEQIYGKGVSWHRCFRERPGTSCAHPLEVQKTFPNYRGDTKDFKVTLQQKLVAPETLLLSYRYAPKKNVAICPHGAVFRVSLMYITLPNGETRTQEHDFKNIPEPSTRNGGEFTYTMTGQPVKSWYLIVKGYYIHPPSGHRR